MTITGIRPDFIRMSQVFKKLDLNFNHILVHTGQHFDSLLSDVFFKDLDIRKPDFNLNIGGPGKLHYHQQADLSVKIIELIKKEKLNPDVVLFLGDSNSVLASIPLKKEGFKIGHIEAGMRSYDNRMLEEINRKVCDSVSDYLFVYHENYKSKLAIENIVNNVFVVGNTIVEPLNLIKNEIDLYQKDSHILLDIHRPENFKHKNRLNNIISYANAFSKHYGLPIKMLNFPATLKYITQFGLDLQGIEVIELMGYIDFVKFQMESKFIFSDSGTAQEEPALLHIPVIVPRDFTERPESVTFGNSMMLDVNVFGDLNEPSKFIETYMPVTQWLGVGTTSDLIVKILKDNL